MLSDSSMPAIAPCFTWELHGKDLEKHHMNFQKLQSAFHTGLDFNWDG